MNRPAQGATQVPGRGGVDRIATVLASFGMSGFFPVAPATFASAITAVLLYWVLPLSPAGWVALVVVLLGVGVWSSGRLERILGQDPSAAVIDEVLGMAVTMIAVPVTPVTLLFGFLLFRVFDVLKVWPGRRVERLHGGWGIMLDDVVAGIYACIGLQLLLRLWPDPQLRAWHFVAGAVAGIVLLMFRKPLFARFGKRRSSVTAALGKRQT